MQLRYFFIISIFLVLISINVGLPGQMPADTLTQPDTTTVVVNSDTTKLQDNSLNDSIAEDFANRLKSQLNLTEEQTEQVRSIIAGYVDNHTSDNSETGTANEQIEKVLNETQRSSWKSIQDSFWSDLKRRIRDDLD